MNLFGYLAACLVIGCIAIVAGVIIYVVSEELSELYLRHEKRIKHYLRNAHKSKTEADTFYE